MKKDLVKLSDLSGEDIEKLLNTADQLKYNVKHHLPHPYLQGKTLVMLFEKSSTRTRVSFETGMYQLGGNAVYLAGHDSQVGRGEPAEDTARALSRYCDGILVRTYAQSEVEELAQYADVPVFNGMTDYTHPFQVLADLMTVRERKVRLEGLNVCYIGDGNNMANALITGCLKCGMNVRAACPEGYLPAGEVLDYAGSMPAGRFLLTREVLTAAADADVVFTDAWVSQGKEAETAARREALRGYQVNDAVLAAAKPDCMVQHPLPAHRGEEITAEVFEAHAGEIFDEAENRLHVQKAVLCLCMQD